MQTLFADTFYWVALIHAKDQWHRQVRAFSTLIQDYSLITTDLVLVEYLNFFAKFDQPMKQGVVNFYRQIRTSPNLQIISVDSYLIQSGVELYANRLDKGYSLTDCISMIVMKQRGIIEVLTHDKHFTQENFRILFQDSNFNNLTQNLIASLIGFVNHDGVGATGLESSMNSKIKGIDGKYSYANGYKAEIPGSQSEIIPAQSGTSIRLTVDRDIQWVASKAIAEVVKSSRALSGTVIVMDPKTGHILAHATAPTFDPNDTTKVSLVAMRNPSVLDVYEPGSTGKVMTIAAALEEKKITPQTVLTIPDKLKRSVKVFRDHEPHPTQRLTTAGVLAVSSNTGSIKIGEMISNDKLYDYLTKFGIGSKTGSGLPGESRGILPKVADWSGTTAPTVAFGQGYSVTAMQATSVFATIANDGVRVSPTVIAGTSDSSGNYTPSATRESVRVISPETASQMRLMMESVVSASGTAPSAAIPGYRVAGKTGTAQRIDDTCGCYRGYTASFIGFAPADKPAYVISVTIQDPKGLHWGGYLGGPVFKKVMSFVLQSKGIAPTGTVVDPLPLNEKALLAERKLIADKKAANVKAN